MKQIQMNDLLLERALTYEEKNQLVADLKMRVDNIDTTLLEAYFDLVDDKNYKDLKIPFEDNGRYYFHVPTGWVISLVRRSTLIDTYRRSKCTKMYIRNFIATMYDIIMNSSKSDEEKEEKIRTSKGLQKLGYRTIMCLRKGDEKAVMLGLARHISVLQRRQIIATRSTYIALLKSYDIAKMNKMAYPDIYKIDRILKSAIIHTDDITYLRKCKKIIDNHSIIYYT